MHREHCLVLTALLLTARASNLSLMTGLHRYYKIWNNFFKPVDALNCGIGGDKVQNVLY